MNMRRRPRNLSIRWRVSLALGAMAFLIIVVAIVSTTAMQRASYLLFRADQSHHQLALATKLSGEIKAYMMYRMDALLQGRHTATLRASRAHVTTLFEKMDAAQQTEIELLQGLNTELDAEQAEVLRLNRLREETIALFGQAHILADAHLRGQEITQQQLATKLLDIFQAKIAPLIDSVLIDEQAEIDSVETSMRTLRTRLMIFGVIVALSCALLAIFAAWHINRAIHRPIVELTKAVSKLSSEAPGEFEMYLGRDELGMLARHFKRMAHHLHRHRKQLEALNNELEKRVAERTELLKCSNARLQQVDESRKRFLSDVSHELRTPLTAILGELELCRSDLSGDDKSLEESLQRVSANADYLRRRVQDLLLLAQSSEGELHMQPALVDLAVVVSDACRHARGIADVEQVKIGVDHKVHVAPSNCDRSWIGQCLIDLIDNAVKFSVPEDTVTVVLDDQESSWRIDIVDQGPGFDEAVLPKLFDRYYQSSDGRRRGGTGLGLSIAHWVIAEHGGKISARNTDRGACISLALPKVEATT